MVRRRSDRIETLRIALTDSLARLPKPTFVRAWCAIAYLFPGLHPDGYDSADSGWPCVLRRFAAEAWRRADAGELTDNELYCYQPCKARLRREREEGRDTPRHFLPDL